MIRKWGCRGVGVYVCVPVLGRLSAWDADGSANKLCTLWFIDL